MTMMHYKGFIGSIETNLEDKCLFGKILYTTDLITYEAKTITVLEKEFKKAVDDYLKTCGSLGREPVKSFKGSLNVRVGAELHKQIAFHAAIQNVTLNEYIKRALEKHVAKEAPVKHK